MALPAARITFDEATAGDGLQFNDDRTSVAVTANDNGWHAAKSAQSFAVGIVYIEFRIEFDALTANTWKMVVGCVPPRFDCRAKAFTCVGSGQGGWGYVGGTGKKYCKRMGPEARYGPPFSTGDVVGMHLDFGGRTVSFFLNNRPLGIAFNTLDGPVMPAVSMTAKDTRISFRIVEAPANYVPMMPMVALPDYRALDKLEDSERIRVLEDTFRFKFISQGPKIDFASSQWANAIGELNNMGFARGVAVEALMVTGDDRKLDIPQAIEYLFAEKGQRQQKFEAAAAAMVGGVGPAAAGGMKGLSSSVSRMSMSDDAGSRETIAQLQAQLTAERKNMEVQVRSSFREAYKTALQMATADKLVNREELHMLESLQKRFKISNNDHAQILGELGVPEADYKAMVSRAREQEETLRAVAKVTKNNSKLNGTVVVLDAANECVVCMERLRNHVIMDCMHLCLCENCAGNFSAGQECPSCRRIINGVRRIY